MIEAPIFHVKRRRPRGHVHGSPSSRSTSGSAGSATSSSTCTASGKHGAQRDGRADVHPAQCSTARSRPTPRSRHLHGQPRRRGFHSPPARATRSGRSTSAALEANLAQGGRSARPQGPPRRGPDLEPVQRAPRRSSSPNTTTPPVQTSVPAEEIDRIVRGLTTVPETFKVNPKIRRLLDARAQAHKDGGPWTGASARRSPSGSLLVEGTPVRLSGQDTERGTFSHPARGPRRHRTRARKYNAAQEPRPEAGPFLRPNNSLLSEGRGPRVRLTATPSTTRTCSASWEAQFGDFANGAQVVIDQFIVSGESKWQRTSGIVLLAPARLRGPGSGALVARLERFLQASAEEDIQVVNVTTAGPVLSTSCGAR